MEAPRPEAPASDWRQRLGAGPRVDPALWVHAASVGEVRAAAPLVERLQTRGEPLLLSTMTVTGRAQCEALHPALPRRLAPLDLRPCVEAALRRAPPRALVMVEAELWPGWIAACARRAAPVLVVSARMSDRTFRRHRALGSWIGRTLRRLQRIGARTEVDAERFLALGAPAERVSVTGDLKLDAGAEGVTPSAELAAWLGEAPLVLAGSVHPGEEGALSSARDAWIEAGRDAALLIAPRHLKRADEIVDSLGRAGVAVRRRSQGGPPLRAGEVALLDSLGELAGAYAHAAIAFVGGSLVPVGGHNLLEPVFAGAPVCFGPHTNQQRHAVVLLEASTAGERVEDEAALAGAICRALADPAAARTRAEAGRRALASHRGSSDRAARLVIECLELRSESAPSTSTGAGG